jgi:uncharacterized protein (DUF433 family)
MVRNEISDNELIARHISDANLDEVDRARLTASGVSVWVLIAQLHAPGETTESVADDYGLSVEAVEAAVAYYHQHAHVIDARITLNNAAFDGS